MSLSKYSILVLLLLITSCHDNGRLNRVCRNADIGNPCVVTEDGWEQYSAYQHKLVYSDSSICSLGRTVCSEDRQRVLCEGYVGPVEETCDGLDNNCDGSTDEGFDLDSDGARVCDGDCDDNNDKVFPLAGEVCDGLDNDCDGEVDEDTALECWDGPEGVIFEGTQCSVGVRHCVDGLYSHICEGQVLPSEEVCDLVDNDCDGTIDIGVVTDGQQCGPPTDLGQCAYGGNLCILGEQLCAFPQPVLSQPEMCDNLDNDCDGNVDEDLERPCFTACGEGVETCSHGSWFGCSAPAPVVEVCDGADNDCDGEVDEGCGCQNGEYTFCIENIVDVNNNPVNCGVGLTQCVDFAWGPCVFLDIEPEECDGHDNDCDGQVDGFTSACGDPSFGNVGECQMGEATCVDGEWGSCDNEVLPAEEVCDQLDNDCDGEIDEGLDPDEVVDMVFVLDISGSMFNRIEALIFAMQAYVSDFEGTEHRFGLVLFPEHEEWDDDLVAPGTPGLVEIGPFVNYLSTVNAGSLGEEPSMDAVHLAMRPDDPLDIGWRPNATPYVILITDELPQSFMNVNENQLGSEGSQCQIGNCESGDRVEIYGIVSAQYNVLFDGMVYNEPERLFAIDPSEAPRYVDILRSIFRNVCVAPSGG